MVCDVDLSIPDATRVHTLAVAGRFAAEGFGVELVTQGPDPTVPGVTHHRVHGAVRPKLARLYRLNAIAIGLLVKRRREASRLYVRNRWTVFPIMAVARLLGYRVVMQVDDMAYGHGYALGIGAAEDYAKRATTYLACRLAHAFVAVTPQLKGLLVDHFSVAPEVVRVLPNGVDVDVIKPRDRAEAIQRTGLDPALRYVVFCGNLAGWVDYDLLLRGFAHAAKERPTARMLFIGDGSERDQVQRLARELEIADRVTLVGFVQDRSQVRDYLAASTVATMAHVSGYVNRIGVSPTKLAEYLAAGRAVVAKGVPGIPEVLEASGGGIAVGDDPEEMGRALSELLDPERADELGRHGRGFAEERLSWTSIVHRTLPLFEPGFSEPDQRADSAAPPLEPASSSR